MLTKAIDITDGIVENIRGYGKDMYHSIHGILMPRRYMRRRTGPRPVVQSFKKVLNFAPTSRAAATTHSSSLVNGVDSIAAGQTSAIDDEVPTGSKVFQIEIQFGASNLVSQASFLHWDCEMLRSGQTSIAPNAVGGDDQRNQIMKQGMMVLGKDQSNNRVIVWKIPKRYQRVREGDLWRFNRTCDTTFTDAVQVIYKFYR